MGNQYSHITPEQADLIERAPCFFVATADPALEKGPADVGPVNVSPKGGTPLHVLSPNKVAYLDYPGSGNETARHSTSGGPVTIMVCAFDEDDAAIVRLYGQARIVKPEDSTSQLLESPADELAHDPRQVIEIDIEQTQTSCGYGVPVMKFVRERRSADRGKLYKSRG
jgi:hypothetical protein